MEVKVYFKKINSIRARAQQEFVSIALLPVYFKLFYLKVKFPFIQRKLVVAIYHKIVSFYRFGQSFC